MTKDLPKRSPLHPEALTVEDLRVGMMLAHHQGQSTDHYLVLGEPHVDGSGDTRALLFKTYHPDEDTDPEAVRHHPGYHVLSADYWLNNLGLAPHPARGNVPAYWCPNGYTIKYESR
ncbi:MAG TPA: hypothetical protein VJ841_05620 [Candidatus Saccharimonadales bacterium]|nr:hypothetical protein [Candidatus Saccharimonadales bacterium]